MKKLTTLSVASFLFLVHAPITIAQSNIVADNFQPGDLLFFWISEKGRHVGIYVEDGLFLHSSTSVGVTLSELDDDYWRYRLISVRRINHDISLDEFKQAHTRYDHARYSYGSTGPDRFDCSGLVWRIFGNHGFDVPRSTRLQIGTGNLVISGQDYLAQSRE